MKSQKKTRNTYSAEFKEEALKLAAKIGMAQAARELSVYESQLYAWRSTAQKKVSTSVRENSLATENARLTRQLAEQAEELQILKQAATYYTKTKSSSISVYERQSRSTLHYQDGLRKMVLFMAKTMSAPEQTPTGAANA